jgi:hypothetical protein
MLTTLAEFVRRVDGLRNIADASEVFEHECSEELKKLLSTLWLIFDPESPEPFRCTMHVLGYTEY